mmetsp:Transcript_4690/g.8628  ORF Transcript_4690/g.8628 Transcript_4690/m.8628 type:complete len:87 (-) Transcript_4690:983-1243(-)
MLEVLHPHWILAGATQQEDKEEKHAENLMLCKINEGLSQFLNRTCGDSNAIQERKARFHPGDKPFANQFAPLASTTLSSCCEGRSA